MVTPVGNHSINVSTPQESIPDQHPIDFDGNKIENYQFVEGVKRLEAKNPKDSSTEEGGKPDTKESFQPGQKV